jgi:hypothetical protein
MVPLLTVVVGTVILLGTAGGSSTVTVPDVIQPLHPEVLQALTWYL